VLSTVFIKLMAYKMLNYAKNPARECKYTWLMSISLSLL